MVPRIETGIETGSHRGHINLSEWRATIQSLGVLMAGWVKDEGQDAPSPSQPP